MELQLLFLVAVLTIAGIYSVLDYECIAGIIICEMVAKSSLLTTTSLLSTPSNNGIGCYFIYSTNIFNYILSTVIVAVIAYLVGDIIWNYRFSWSCCCRSFNSIYC